MGIFDIIKYLVSEVFEFCFFKYNLTKSWKTLEHILLILGYWCNLGCFSVQTTGWVAYKILTEIIVSRRQVKVFSYLVFPLLLFIILTFPWSSITNPTASQSPIKLAYYFLYLSGRFSHAGGKAIFSHLSRFMAETPCNKIAN